MRDLMRQSAAKAAGANAQCNVVPKDWPAKEPAPSKSNHADGEEAGTRQGPQSAEASGSRKHGEGRAQQGTESQPWAAAKAPSLAGETVTAIPGATSSTIEAADSMQELTAKSWAPVIAEHLQHPNRSREAAQAAAEPAADLAPAAQEQPGMVRTNNSCPGHVLLLSLWDSCCHAQQCCKNLQGGLDRSMHLLLVLHA
jgi:hypothetical protein